MAQASQLSQHPADTSEEVLETTVGGVLRAAAAAWPDREALVAGVPDPSARRRWTYPQLLGDAERCARALLGRFEPGQHLAVGSLPLTGSGKVQKFVLREQLARECRADP